MKRRKLSKNFMCLRFHFFSHFRSGRLLKRLNRCSLINILHINQTIFYSIRTGISFKNIKMHFLSIKFRNEVSFKTKAIFLWIIVTFKNVWMICSMLILSCGGGGWWRGGGINSPLQWRILSCGSSFFRYWSGSSISKMFWIRIPHLLKNFFFFCFFKIIFKNFL